MIITVEQYPDDPKYRQKVTIEINDDADISEMIGVWKLMLLALEYHSESVKEIFKKLEE